MAAMIKTMMTTFSFNQHRINLKRRFVSSVALCGNKLLGSKLSVILYQQKEDEGIYKNKC